MHEAMLFDRLDQSRAGCNICRWRCRINPGKTGVCRMYKNLDGSLYSLNYAMPSSMAVDPIEKKPLYHFFPGSKVFSMGSLGCNFRCQDCQNWQISTAGEPVSTGNGEVSPQQAVSLARQYGCEGIAWTYNEPTVWFEYTYDTARLARNEGLYTVYVTNGYMTIEALDTLGPYLNAWRVDVKGFTDDFYLKWSGIRNWRGILQTAEHALKHWGMHVEVVTNIIPSMNDDEQQLRGIAGWIAGSLGVLTPWHVTRFHPYEQMASVGPTPIETLEKAVAIGRQAGLKFVYVGNVPGSGNADTVCFNCSGTLVERNGYRVKLTGSAGSKCRYCGTELNLRTGQGGG